VTERDDAPLLPDVTSDEGDEGWGDARRSDDDDVRRLIEERPPHHDRDDV
jgi:hypothetical protein